MAEFLSTFVFILPGIMSYFWLQLFGLNPAVKHTAPELSGIAALLWLPVSFVTLLVLNAWGRVNSIESLAVDQVWNMESLSTATSDIKYLILFLTLSMIVSFILCAIWSKWCNNILLIVINKIRKKRKIAPLSKSSTVWEEFFIRIQEEDTDKEGVYILYKIDAPKEFIIGSMTKASRPFETDRSIVLDDTQEWLDSLKHYDYKVKRSYIDLKTGVVVKELDHKNPIEKTIPENKHTVKTF